jgi:hypothetical protein
MSSNPDLLPLGLCRDLCHNLATQLPRLSVSEILFW